MVRMRRAERGDKVFWIILFAGIVCVPIYKKLKPDTFWFYFLWVLFIETINMLLFGPLAFG